MKRDPNNNKVAETALKCLQCLLGCLEKFVQFFNNHAYVEMVINSTNYCVSARNGMRVVGRNILRFGILHGMSEIVLNFVVAFIVLIGTYTGYLALQIAHPENNEFHGQVACLVIIGLTMFVVAKLFAHIWEVGSDTILHCHCIDECLEGGNARNAPKAMADVLSNAETKEGAGAGGYM